MKGRNQKSCFLSFLFLLGPIHAQSSNNTTNTVVATINTGVTPTGIAVSPDNSTAFVANSNAFGIMDANTVSVLNLRNNTLRTTISDPSFSQPSNVTLNANGTRAYVTNSGSNTISIINTATSEVIGTIEGFDGPSGMVITPNGRTAYVINNGSASGAGTGNGTTVQAVDLTNNMIIGDPITVGQGPTAIAITPNGQFVYVTSYVNGNQGTGTVTTIQTSDNTVVDTIPGFSGPSAIAISSDGRFAYVTNSGNNNSSQIGTTLDVIRLSDNSIVRSIPLGIQPSGVAVSPNGRFVYVTNFNTLSPDPSSSDTVAGQGTVNIIDTTTGRVVPPTIAVGQSPDSIVISENGRFAYVTNSTSNTVSVIELSPRQTVR